MAWSATGTLANARARTPSTKPLSSAAPCPAVSLPSLVTSSTTMQAHSWAATTVEDPTKDTQRSTLMASHTALDSVVANRTSEATAPADPHSHDSQAWAATQEAMAPAFLGDVRCTRCTLDTVGGRRHTAILIWAPAMACDRDRAMDGRCIVCHTDGCRSP
jgi:hypothetical protein